MTIKFLWRFRGFSFLHKTTFSFPSSFTENTTSSPPHYRCQSCEQTPRHLQGISEQARAQDKRNCPVSSHSDADRRADERLFAEENKTKYASGTGESNIHVDSSSKNTSRYQLSTASSPCVNHTHIPSRGAEKKNERSYVMKVPEKYSLHNMDENIARSENYFESRWLSREAAIEGMGSRGESAQSEIGCCSSCPCCRRQMEGEGQGEVKERGQGEIQANVCDAISFIDTANDSKASDGIVANHGCKASNSIDSSCIRGCIRGCGCGWHEALEREIFAQFKEIARGLDEQQLNILKLSETSPARERLWQSEVREGEGGRGRESKSRQWNRFPLCVIVSLFFLCVCLPVI